MCQYLQTAQLLTADRKTTVELYAESIHIHTHILLPSCILLCIWFTHVHSRFGKSNIQIFGPPLFNVINQYVLTNPSSAILAKFALYCFVVSHSLKFLAYPEKMSDSDYDLTRAELIKQLISDSIDQALLPVDTALGERQDSIERSTEKRLQSIKHLLVDLRLSCPDTNHLQKSLHNNNIRCWVCEGIFCSLSSYDKHIEDNHPTLHCKFCEKITRSIPDLYLHLHRYHTSHNISVNWTDDNTLDGSETQISSTSARSNWETYNNSSDDSITPDVHLTKPHTANSSAKTMPTESTTDIDDEYVDNEIRIIEDHLSDVLKMALRLLLK